MRIGAFFLFLLLLMGILVPSGLASLPAPESNPNNLGACAASPANGGLCGLIFVAGKGTIDSCSRAHPDLSRVYPRKPGIPPNGCAPDCPAPEETPETNGEAPSS